jgi:hypothetical protein
MSVKQLFLFSASNCTFVLLHVVGRGRRGGLRVHRLHAEVPVQNPELRKLGVRPLQQCRNQRTVRFRSNVDRNSVRWKGDDRQDSP